MVQVFSVVMPEESLRWLEMQAKEAGQPMAIFAGELLEAAVQRARESIESQPVKPRTTQQEKQLELWEIDRYNSHYDGGL